MSVTSPLNPNDPAFERFLFASVGEDLNGAKVTMLSVLARLNLDPWEEAAGLAASRRDAAVSRLGMLLSRCRDVPALATGNSEVARMLAPLLPGSAPASAAGDDTRRKLTFSPAILLTAVIVTMILLELVFSGTWGGV